MEDTSWSVKALESNIRAKLVDGVPGWRQVIIGSEPAHLDGRWIRETKVLPDVDTFQPQRELYKASVEGCDQLVVGCQSSDTGERGPG